MKVVAAMDAAFVRTVPPKFRTRVLMEFQARFVESALNTSMPTMSFIVPSNRFNGSVTLAVPYPE